jgi:hypothetical protein
MAGQGDPEKAAPWMAARTPLKMRWKQNDGEFH